MGFGLANDERRGRADDFADAFRIARNAGLAGVPHGGELLGADSVRGCLDVLGATRIGHGVRSVEDADLVKRLADDGVALEVCPASNVALGVYETLADVPVRTLVDAGVEVALAADDPLLFGSRLTAQYEAARDVHGFDDHGLADLARSSVNASLAPEPHRQQILQGIDAWLAPLTLRGSRQRWTPTRVGSACNVTPNRSRTPARTVRARSKTSSVVAPPRLVTASVCLVERVAAPVPSSEPNPFGKPARSINQAADVFTRPSVCNHWGASGGTSRCARTGLVKNEPADQVSWSASSSTIPLARRSSSTAARTSTSGAASPTLKVEALGELGVMDWGTVRRPQEPKLHRQARRTCSGSDLNTLVRYPNPHSAGSATRTRPVCRSNTSTPATTSATSWP